MGGGMSLWVMDDGDGDGYMEGKLGVRTRN